MTMQGSHKLFFYFIPASFFIHLAVITFVSLKIYDVPVPILYSWQDIIKGRDLKEKKKHFPPAGFLNLDQEKVRKDYFFPRQTGVFAGEIKPKRDLVYVSLIKEVFKKESELFYLWKKKRFSSRR